MKNEGGERNPIVKWSVRPEIRRWACDRSFAERPRGAPRPPRSGSDSKMSKTVTVSVSNWFYYFSRPCSSWERVKPVVVFPPEATKVFLSKRHWLPRLTGVDIAEPEIERDHFSLSSVTAIVSCAFGKREIYVSCYPVRFRHFHRIHFDSEICGTLSPIGSNTMPRGFTGFVGSKRGAPGRQLRVAGCKMASREGACFVHIEDIARGWS